MASLSLLSLRLRRLGLSSCASAAAARPLFVAVRIQQGPLAFGRAARRALASSSSSPPPPPPSQHQQPPSRLRRPARFDSLIRRGGGGGGGASPSSRSGGAAALPEQRPHSITFFPGDFGNDNAADDADGYYDPWDDDEADEDGLFASALREAPDPDALDQSLYLDELRQHEADLAVKKERWLKAAAKPVRLPKIDPQSGRAYGRGGRKRAQARVWIEAGLGEVVVNRRPLLDYFDRMSDRELVLAPMVATETAGRFDVVASVRGGGLTGQAGAIRLGLSRALQHYNPDDYRPPLKRLGYLTRDARKVERKKIGRVKARKSPQWVRR